MVAKPNLTFYFRAEMDGVTTELKKQTQDPKLQQTLELKMKRLLTEQKVS